MKSNDPTEWADKRRAAMERAKQIREERKSAALGEMTFKPQINKRPSYLDDKQADSLDILTSNNSVPRFDKDDIFEQPLPGNQKIKIPSPGSDSLGRELKKYPEYPDYDQSSNSQFKSKFLQKYQEEPKINQNKFETNSQSQNNPNDLDDEFFNSLRGGAKSTGPGWNSDTSGSGFDKLPKQSSRVVDRREGREGSHGNINLNSQNMKNTNLKSKLNPKKSSDWNFDTDLDAIPQVSVKQSVEANIISPRGKGDIMQARSRLSLLKSKLRKSDETAVAPPPNYLRTQSVEQSFRSVSKVSSKSSFEENHIAPKSAHESRSLNRNTESEFPYNSEQQFDNIYNNPSSKNPASKARPQQNSIRNVPDTITPRQLPTSGLEQQNINSQRKSSIQSEPSEFPDDSAQQIECPDCGRKFNPGPFEKHAKICRKVFIEKRKVFDSKQMRIEDNPELVKILKETAKKEKSLAKKVNKSSAPTSQSEISKKEKWKIDSENFREAIKAGRQLQKALDSGGPLPEYKPSAPDPSLIPCPHCGRSFNQKAGERHIPQCQNIRAKPSSLKKGAGTGLGTALHGSSGLKNSKSSFGKGRF